jgi:hypothetical protein
MSNIAKSRLISEIAARLQIRLDEDDPAFVIVELNRMILDQAVRTVFQTMRERKFAATGASSPDLQLAEEIATRVAERVNANLAPTLVAILGPQDKVEARTRTPNIAWATILHSAPMIAALLALLFGATWIGYQLALAYIGAS